MTEIPLALKFVFDGKGGIRTSSEDMRQTIADVEPGAAFVWLHINKNDPDVGEWLVDAGVDQFVAEALLAVETRPRCTVHGDGAVLNLRGVNLNPGAEPEDMISIRLWIEKDRVISLWGRPLTAVAELIQAVKRGLAPLSPGDLVAKLALRLADGAEPTVASLNERIDTMEELVLDSSSAVPRGQLADVRRTAIVLRRYMFPQRDALATLEIEDLNWLENVDRSRIREAAERVTRLGEELDAIRDRAQVVHDQIMDHRSETMNRQMLVLSLVAAVFLPLSLLTGLLGINVGGIPGANSPYGFVIVCGILAVLAIFQIWLFKKLGMFR